MQPGPSVYLLTLGVIAAAAPLLLLFRRHAVTADAQAEQLRGRLALVLESVPGGFALCDDRGRLQLANSRFRRLFPRIEPGAPLGALLPAGAGDPGAFDHGLPDDSWHRVTRQPLPEGGFTLATSDITPLKRQEQALAIRSARQQAMLELAPVGIWELDEAQRTVFANPQLAVLMGGAVPVGLAGAGLRRPASHGRAAAEPLQHLPPPHAPVEVELPRRGGTRRLMLVASGPLESLHAEAGKAPRLTRLVTLLDITDRRVGQAEVERLAWHDPLTGLGNRARFAAMLEARLASGEVTLLSICLTGLGQVNERHGRDVGDAVLRAAALRLSQSLRAEDAVFRTGGSRFAVLTPAMDQSAARSLCGRLSEVLAESFRHGTPGMTLPPAIGVASSVQTRAGSEMLRRAADLALQRSAAEGRTPVFYEDALGAAADRRQRLREALARAIPAVELKLLWQPLIDTRDRRMVGAEALLRWDCVSLGREVMPAEFLLAATGIGLLGDIDFWMLWSALSTWRGWAGRPGAPEVVSVTMSGGTLLSADFPDQVRAALGRHGAGAQELEIGIPEDIPPRDLPALRRNLEALRRMGVGLALNDFGGGASSMAHLVQLPAGRVKLDRSIIRKLPGGAREGAIIGAVATLARALHVEMVANGVETEDQAAALRARGCHVMQGPLFGPPVAADLLVPPEE
nr:EAL domain-containing protein [Roseomonas marmotae]